MNRTCFSALPLFALFAAGQIVSDFPAGAICTDKKMDGIKNEWYSQELGSLREPSVWRISRERPNVDVYRFLWLRAFHLPISVRLTINEDESAWLIWKEGTIHDATEFGKLSRVGQRPITRQQVRKFLDAVQTARFWNIRSPSSELGGPDGSEWIIEGVWHGQYKIVNVYSAPADNPIHWLGMMMVLDLAGIKVPPELIY